MSKTFKILVVDDDDEIGVMMKLMLEHKGFSVTVLQRTEPIEAIILNHAIDLIILDMLIAGVKGTDVCIRLKSNAGISHLPVIMITALPDAEITCKQAGADDFLSKPFEMDTLISKVNYFITKKYQGQHPVHP